METSETDKNSELICRLEEFFSLLQEIKAQQAELIMARKEVMTFSEGAKYMGLSESHLYRLTSKRKIPFYKQGKLIYFVREELDKWRTANKIKTREQIEAEALARLQKMKNT